MPKVSYNDPKVAKLYGSGAKTIRFKTKGQFVKFVLGSSIPTMYGLHWIDKKAYSCPRVNEEKECVRCQEGFDLLVKVKEENLDKESKEFKAAKKTAMDKLPNISFYYPIFSVEGSFGTGAFLLETVKTVYQRFGDLEGKGKDLMGLLWQIDRTEKPGNYYTLDDVGDAPELSAEDLEELTKVADIDIDASMNYVSINDYYAEHRNVELKEGEEEFDPESNSISDLMKDKESEEGEEEETAAGSPPF